MKNVLLVLIVIGVNMSAQAATLRCGVSEGNAFPPKIVQVEVDTNVDPNDTSSYLKKYSVAETSSRRVVVTINNLSKEILLFLGGTKQDDLSVGATGSFEKVSVGIASLTDSSKNLSVQCSILQ